MILTIEFFVQYNNLLENICYNSRMLYNEALLYIKNNEPNNYFEIINNLKNISEYKDMPKAQSAQQTIRAAYANFKSYNQLLQLSIKGKYNKPVNFPAIINAPFVCTFTNQCSQIKIIDDEYFVVLNKDISIKIPNNVVPKNLLLEKEFKQINIIPTKTNFKISITYEAKPQYLNLIDNSYMSIDLGAVNLCSMVDNINNKAHIIRNGKIRNILEKYLYQIRNKTSKVKREKIISKRNKRIKDALHKISRKIVNYCAQNKIQNIIIGKNKDWKQKSNLGKKNNFYFVGTAHSKLISMIKYKAELLGINVRTTEESYTSKCDFLAKEKIQKHKIYSGKRITRGLFQSKQNILINADINAACNILAKFLFRNNSSIEILKSLFEKGVRLTPIIWNY